LRQVAVRNGREFDWRHSHSAREGGARLIRCASHAKQQCPAFEVEWHPVLQVCSGARRRCIEDIRASATCSRGGRVLGPDPLRVLGDRGRVAPRLSRRVQERQGDSGMELPRSKRGPRSRRAAGVGRSSSLPLRRCGTWRSCAARYRAVSGAIPPKKRGGEEEYVGGIQGLERTLRAPYAPASASIALPRLMGPHTAAATQVQCG
jgi:hypothetical protein